MKQESRSAEAAPEEELIEEVAPAEGAELLLELLLQEESSRASEEEVAALSERIDGVILGQLVALGEGGEAVVTFAGAPAGGFQARTMAELGVGDVGREVALLFEGGNPRRPVVMGRMHAPGVAARQPAPEASADGERIEFSAEKEIVLRCGKASITLTRAGKIILRGAYLLARSSGVNRIQGGSVQIN